MRLEIMPRNYLIEKSVFLISHYYTDTQRRPNIIKQGYQVSSKLQILKKHPQKHDGLKRMSFHEKHRLVIVHTHFYIPDVWE